MATLSIPIVTTTAVADTAASFNSLVQRDSAGGVYGTVIQGSTLSTTGNQIGTVVAKSASFTAGLATDYVCDCTAGNITVALPLASANAGVSYWFTKKDAGSNAVTLSGVSGTGTISAQYGRLRAFSDGTNWYSA